MDMATIEPLKHRNWLDETHSATLGRALGGETGFVKLSEAEMSPAASPLAAVFGPTPSAWLNHVHSAHELTSPIGCYFARNLVHREHGLAFEGDHLIVENSHLSDVSIEWARAQIIRHNHPNKPIRRLSDAIINAIGPGYMIYGHWIVDFLPRIAIAQRTLGAAFHQFKILLPSECPRWIFKLLELVLGISENAFALYDPSQEAVTSDVSCIPTYAHGAQYGFNSIITDVYKSPRLPSPSNFGRKICISRKNLEKGTVGQWKIYEDRVEFENIAAQNGFDIVIPEDYTLTEQISMFRSCSIIVGEYGSALHNSIFCGSDVLVAAIRCPNNVQSMIAAITGQSMIYATPSEEWTDELGVQRYKSGSEQIHDLFSSINDFCKKLNK